MEKKVGTGPRRDGVPLTSMAAFSDITGVILAGGRSRRMGRDKATLSFDGTTLFDRTLQIFEDLFHDNLIAGDRPDLEKPHIPALADRYPGSALGGLYTGLEAAQTPYIFVAACDMPFIDPAIIRLIAERRRSFDAVIPRTGQGLEPLFGIYGKRCLEPIKQQLEEGNFRVFDFYDQVKIRYLEEDELPPDWQRTLANVNTPEELDALNRPG